MGSTADGPGGLVGPADGQGGLGGPGGQNASAGGLAGPGVPGGLDSGRRKFLLLAGAVLGAGAGAAIGLSIPRSARPHSTLNPAGGTVAPAPSASVAAGGTPTQAPSPMAANWAALSRELSSGRLVRPGSTGYGQARLLFDPRFDDARPAGIAYCAVPADVSACLAFARRFGVPVAVRSGGHSYGGWSTTSGLVIDVSQMNRVAVNAAAGSASIGSGTKLIDLYNALAADGVAVPGGSCPTVGVAGLALGGGIGVTGRLFGLTCDNIASVQIVTADGAVRECGPASEPDLFWACRGGGGGSFGVLTAFTFRTHPAPGLVLFYLRWPWWQAPAVVSAWQSWAPFAPDELWSNVHLSAAPGGGEPLISVGGTYAGSSTRAQALLDRLYESVGSPPASAFAQAESYLSVMLVEAGCASLSVPQCHLPWQNPAGALGRQPELAKSDFYRAKLPPQGISTLLGQVERMNQVAGARGATGGVALDAFGGMINRVGQADTAFAHRDALFLAQYTTTWDAVPGADAAGVRSAPVRRQRAWLRSFWSAMRPYASGEAYQNYADPDLTDWQRAYYGPNYPRLQQVKAAMDPANVFRFPQSVELPRLVTGNGAVGARIPNAG